jgi:Ser/Thr protein kinase RdoA (MazF antagonist)
MAATREAGSALALLHTLLRDFVPPASVTSTSYHRLAQIPAQLPTLCERLDPALKATGESLARAYQEASDRVDAAGFANWPAQMVHGDWHPGNMLFSGSRVAAVLDFDTVRREPRATDVANGALQFSITRLGENPEVWPSDLDEARFGVFLEGYDSMSPAGAILSRAELGAMAWLMVEAMVAEAFVPIAATGRFGPIPGGAFLRMVERKVEWLTRNHERLSRAAG